MRTFESIAGRIAVLIGSINWSARRPTSTADTFYEIGVSFGEEMKKLIGP